MTLKPYLDIFRHGLHVPVCSFGQDSEMDGRTDRPGQTELHWYDRYSQGHIASRKYEQTHLNHKSMQSCINQPFIEEDQILWTRFYMHGNDYLWNTGIFSDMNIILWTVIMTMIRSGLSGLWDVSGIYIENSIKAQIH